LLLAHPQIFPQIPFSIPFFSNKAKGLVWEHNTHVGDTGATDMADEGMVNVGQILH
jgi:hypothetical protein